MLTVKVSPNSLPCLELLKMELVGKYLFGSHGKSQRKCYGGIICNKSGIIFLTDDSRYLECQQAL